MKIEQDPPIHLSHSSSTIVAT